MDLRDIGRGGGCGLHLLAQGRDRWRAVRDAVMNLRVLAPWLVSLPVFCYLTMWCRVEIALLVKQFPSNETAYVCMCIYCIYFGLVL
jgi:hypothetical protein